VSGVHTDPHTEAGPLAELVGSHSPVPCIDGTERPYRDLDCAASTPALRRVADRVNAFLPTYASVHRGTGWKSREATRAFEDAREEALAFASARAPEQLAVICRNTTEAINHAAYRIDLGDEPVVALSVVEHHANMLPWGRVAQLRWIECGSDGTFGVDDVVAVLEAKPTPSLLTITAASNVTGWLPPTEAICDAAHERGVPVFLDAAQLAPHRPIPPGPDYVALSGHKLYAPYGAGALIGPRSTFEHGDPFLAGGGAVDLVELDEVIWTEPPEREEAGSPNVPGAVALGEAIRGLHEIGWPAIEAHEAVLARRLRAGLSAIDGVRLLGPALETDTLAVATFTVEGMHHALVAARLSAEWGIGVRHGCFCAHPYLLRLLGTDPREVADARSHIRRGERAFIPGAVRASAGLGTSDDDVDQLLEAVTQLASKAPAPVPYLQDLRSGEFWPQTDVAGWREADQPAGPACTHG
jgi:selenocysteine lyase/cysteine desulfurase